MSNETIFALFVIGLWAVGIFKHTWWPLILVGTVLLICGIAFRRREDGSGVPSKNYHPEAGTGVKAIGLNRQPLPNAQYNEIVSNHSNGWTLNTSTGYWEKDTGDMYGYFKDGKFIKFAKGGKK